MLSMNAEIQQQCIQWVQAIDANLQTGSFEAINEIRMRVSGYLDSLFEGGLSSVRAQLRSEILTQETQCKIACMMLQQAKQKLAYDQAQVQVTMARLQTGQIKPMPSGKELAIQSTEVGVAEAWVKHFEAVVEHVAELRTILLALYRAQ